jgi:ferrous-iron efflux pump FieF
MQSARTTKSLVTMAALASIGTAILMITAKIFAYIATDSMAILATLLDSLLDLGASFINFIAIRFALTPADNEHRFGHGKAEALAALGQVTLILVSAILLIIESSKRLFDPVAVENPIMGIYLSVFAIILTLLLVSFQKYVYRKTGSLAIEADSMHYQTDLFLNASVMVSLILTYITNIIWIDPVLSILIGCYIAYGAKNIGFKAADQLMDKELPEEMREKIIRLATAHKNVMNIHDLRTRASGVDTFIQFHMELDPFTPLHEAHRLSEEVELDLREHFPTTEIFIHLDPVGFPRERE